MRVAFIGASHWHLDLYLQPFFEIADAELVGISDPDPTIVETLRRRLGCDGDADFRALCHRVKPDFVFALGRHADMPEEASFLIAEGIPFALEKPCGMTQRAVGAIAEQAERAGAFAAVPLVFRNGDFASYLTTANENDAFHYMSFRFIAGFPARYRQANSSWMLAPALSGGGSTINLAVHFFDLCRTLLGPGIKVHAATMSNTAWNEPVEDYSAVTLESNGRLGLVETGYLYPAPTSTFDMHYALRSNELYVIAHDPQTVESLDNDGRSTIWNAVTTNVPHYKTFVEDVIRRAREGRAPLASLSDMVPIMGLVEDAYAIANVPSFRPKA
jgi:predicted dehydrogenase